MPLNQPLKTIQRELITLMADDLAAALLRVKELLPEFAEKQSSITAFQGRLNDSNKSYARNTIAYEQHQREIDRIRAELFDLVQSLEEEDFNPVPPPRSAMNGKKGRQTGSVLYRIPHKMLLKKTVRCVVRVAMDADNLVENITLDDAVSLRHNLLISNVMEAQVLDPEGSNFHIATPNAARQLVSDSGYTEWLFFVTPLTPGNHELIVKVSMLENVPDIGLVPREVSLEEMVEIVTIYPEPEPEAPLKPAGVRFELGDYASKLYSHVPPVVGKSEAQGPFYFNIPFLPINVILGIFFIVHFILLPWYPPIYYYPYSDRVTQYRKASITVLSPADSIAQKLRVAGKDYELTPQQPKMWTTVVNLPVGQNSFSIEYKGDKKTGYWIDPLKDSINFFSIFDCTDTNFTYCRCGLFVAVDTVVHPYYKWRLKWKESPPKEIVFRAYPVNNQLFYVFLKDRCDDIYSNLSTPPLVFENGPVSCTFQRHSYIYQPFDKRPDTLYFSKSLSPKSPAPGGPISITPPVIPVTSSSYQAALTFSRPIHLSGIRVNGYEVIHFLSYANSSNPNKSNAVKFGIDGVNVPGLTSPVQRFTIQVESKDCKCKPKTIPIPLNNYNIEDTVICLKQQPPAPKPPTTPPPPPKDQIEITYSPSLDLEGHRDDLDFWIDDEFHVLNNNELSFKGGKIILKLPKNCHKICLYFQQGEKSGDPLNLGCYEGPIEDGLQLRLISGRIVRPRNNGL